MSWPPHVGVVGALVLAAIGASLIGLSDLAGKKANRSGPPDQAWRGRDWGQNAPQPPQGARSGDLDLEVRLRVLQDRLDRLEARVGRVEWDQAQERRL